jgi:hypothetical protein
VKVLGGYEDDPLGQQADLHRERALGAARVAELAEEVAAEGVDVAVGGEGEGVRVADARVAHHESEEADDEARHPHVLRVAVAQLPVDAPAPGEEPAVRGHRRRVVTPWGDEVNGHFYLRSGPAMAGPKDNYKYKDRHQQLTFFSNVLISPSIGNYSPATASTMIS